jgi:acyl-coenzyme A thioesterase PaaI-like protein
MSDSNGCAHTYERSPQVTPERFPAKLLGLTITRDEHGRATVEFEAGERHANPLGTLHEGVLCDLADAAMAVAIGARLRWMRVSRILLKPFARLMPKP